MNGILVRLNICLFCNTRQDDGITRDVKTFHKLTGNAGKWTRYKLPEETLAPLRKAAAATRTAHYELTLPWVEGYRLLPLDARPQYEARMAAHREAFQTLVDKFVSEYPAAVEKAKEMHNGTFNPDDYPTADNCRQHFGFKTEFTPVPRSEHFVGVVTGQALQQLRTELEAQNQQRIQDAVREVWFRLLEPVRKMADTLSQKDAVFRDTLVENVREICEVVPSLNITSDPALLQAARTIRESLATLNPDTLRNSRIQRRVAAEAAGQIVRTFGTLGSRKITND